jgi:hypothetical protein
MVINLEHVKARAQRAAQRSAAQRRKTSHAHAHALTLTRRTAHPVQMLVTSEEALIPNSDLPEVSAFAAALSKRLKLSGGIVHARSVDVRLRTHFALALLTHVLTWHAADVAGAEPRWRPGPRPPRRLLPRPVLRRRAAARHCQRLARGRGLIGTFGPRFALRVPRARKGARGRLRRPGDRSR